MSGGPTRVEPAAAKALTWTATSLTAAQAMTSPAQRNAGVYNADTGEIDGSRATGTPGPSDSCNQIGDEADLAEFVTPADTGPDPGNGHITGWRWKPVPEPKLAALAPRRGRPGR
jgi:hypothetical protein